MREIKFRAFWKDTGKFIPDFMEEYVIDSLNCGVFIVDQFTGLCDKNGKDIYEGDIVRSKHIDEYYDERKVTEKIEVIETLNNYVERLIWVPTSGEVIGNIHENPELLKEIK